MTKAIEIAKEIGSKESGAFINGVLGSIIKHDSVKDRLRKLNDESKH